MRPLDGCSLQLPKLEELTLCECAAQTEDTADALFQLLRNSKRITQLRLWSHRNVFKIGKADSKRPPGCVTFLRLVQERVDLSGLRTLKVDMGTG